MNKVKIAHLYYDLMNLYGENGNVRVLVRALEKQELKVQVDFLSIEDKIDFSKYDIFYIGTGSEENQLLVLHNLKKYKKEIKKAIDSNKLFIVTGNAVELFGKKIINLENEATDALGIFDYGCKVSDARIIGEQVYETEFIDKDIIGFQNRQTNMINCTDNLFRVKTGNGYDIDSNYEGVHKNNFFGTYLLGPLLVRNPYFLEYLIKTFMQSINKEYKSISEDVMYKAYDEYIRNFVKE